MNQQHIRKWPTCTLVATLAFPLVFTIALYATKELWSPSSPASAINPPISLDNLQLSDTDERRLPTAELQGQWWIAYLTTQQCEQQCEQQVQKLQSLQLSLHEELDAVKTVLISSRDHKGSLLQHSLQQLYPHLRVVLTSPQAMEKLEDTIVIANPNGYIIMSYPGKTTKTGLLRELRKLLKVSHG